jgi:uncharacterized protein YggE
MKVAHVVWISALVLAASAIAGIGAPRLISADTGDPPPGTLSVLGNGSVTTTPDTARLSAGVTTQGSTASDAIAANADAMSKVIDALKRAGVASKDLQTQYVSVDPRYDDNGTQTIVGYSASNSVSAVVHRLPDVGDVIDAAVAAGANNVSGPSLAREDQDKLYRDALEDAVANARQKATALARVSGLSLGAIRSLSESPQGGGPIVYGGFDAMAARQAAPTPIEPGTADITATVRVVFAVS